MVATKNLVQVGARIWRVRNTNFASNTYICTTQKSGECFVVDPGLDSDVIDSALSSLGLKPRFLFCTHGHFDHTGSASFLQKKYAAKVFMHGQDVKTLKASNFLLMAFKLEYRIELPTLEPGVGDGFSLKVDNEEVCFHATAGHTPGSCIVEFEQALFSGDSLYSEGLGLSRLPGEDSARLRASLLKVWDRFPRETMVYPGHGEAASFGWIKDNNHKLLRFLKGSDACEAKVAP